VPPSHSLSRLLDADVSLLRWPSEELLREQHAWFGVPRILVVDTGVPPPQVLDPLEDWVRDPPDPVDLRARCEVLRRRAATSPEHLPIRWVALTASQAPVLRLLLDNLDRVVRFEAVVASYEEAGGSGHPASVRTLISRLGARARSVGLELVSVRRRGVLLTTGLDGTRRLKAERHPPGQTSTDSASLGRDVR
jgi:two-component system OmpR family response regulator